MLVHKCERIKFEIPEDYRVKRKIKRAIKDTMQGRLREYYLSKRDNELELVIMRTDWSIRTWPKKRIT